MEDKKLKCVKCGKEYESYALYNFNLGLCQDCDNDKNVERAEFIDKVTHTITCPLCNATYGMEIVDEKCKTKDCPVHFFWDSLDCQAFARWIKNDDNNNT